MTETLSAIKKGQTITIPSGNLKGDWFVVEISGWGSKGDSARLARMGKRGPLKSMKHSINLSESELRKIGLTNKAFFPKTTKVKSPKNESPKNESLAYARNLKATAKKLLEGIEPGQPILSSRDRSRRAKAFAAETRAMRIEEAHGLI